jgi:hypothetical protein
VSKYTRLPFKIIRNRKKNYSLHLNYTYIHNSVSFEKYITYGFIFSGPSNEFRLITLNIPYQINRKMSWWRSIILYDVRVSGDKVKCIFKRDNRRLSPTAKVRAQSQGRPCAICSGKSGTGTGLSSSYPAFPRMHHCTNAPQSFTHLSPTLYRPNLSNWQRP